jgi:hypothetical protein
VLPFDIPVDSAYRLLYSGPVGVSGVDVQQTWDLTKLPKYLREIPSFRDDFRIFVRQVDVGISNVSKDVNFAIDSSGVIVGLVLTLTAADPANLIDIEAWFLHSTVR